MLPSPHINTFCMSVFWSHSCVLYKKGDVFEVKKVIH